MDLPLGLSWKERLAYKMLGTLRENPKLQQLALKQHDFLLRHFVHASTQGRVYCEGTENVPIGRSLIIAPNHRTLFDLFVTMERIWRLFPETPELYCPVRTEFWYETISGTVLNTVLCAGAMYPPIFRDKRGPTLNRVAVDICVEHLKKSSRAVLGIHPEGKRNTNPDLYSYLPPKPGIGRIALRSGAPIVPVFVGGLAGSYLGVVANALNPKMPPVRVFFGKPIDIEDLRGRTDKEAHHEIANRTMAAIAELGEKDRQYMAQR